MATETLPRGTSDPAGSAPGTPRSWHVEEPDGVLETLQIDRSGLPDAEARRRLEVLGPNTLPRAAAEGPLVLHTTSAFCRRSAPAARSRRRSTWSRRWRRCCATGSGSPCRRRGWCRKSGLRTDADRAAWPQVDTVAFDSERQFMATLHACPATGHVIHLKGAPEVVLARCNAAADGVPLDRDVVLAQVERLAARGMRVLPFAARASAPAPTPTGEVAR